MRYLRPLLLALAITAACGLGQTRKSDAASAKSGPTLEVTMRFIQGILNDIGTVNFVAFAQDTSNGSTFQTRFVEEYRNVRVDASACTAGFHVKRTRNGTQNADADVQVHIADVQDVVVEPEAQHTSDLTAFYGHPEVVATSTNPVVTALVVRYRHKNLGDSAFF
jgi:hypothetical protein